MASTGQRNKRIDGINVTPFVDIVLVLLVILIATMKIVGDKRAVQADLPRAATAQVVTERNVTIVVDKDGQVSMDGESMRGDALTAAVQKLDRSARVVIAADGRVAHSAVVELIDVLASAGVSRVSFAARPK